MDNYLEANIPKFLWDDCLVTDDGTIFQPSTDKNGIIVKTARAIYEEYLNQPPPEPSPVEVLREESRQMIVDKDLEIIELRRMMTDLDLTVRGGDSSGQSAN